MSNADILRDAYPGDLEPSLSDELVQFSGLLKTDFGKRAMRACPLETTNDADNDNVDNDDVTFMNESVELRMHRLVVDNHMETVFPNTAIALRIYLCLLISNCSGERSFSKLARIKTQFRSCIGQTRLNMLSVLSIEHALLRSIDLASIIRNFANRKSRKHDI